MIKLTGALLSFLICATAHAAYNPQKCPDPASIAKIPLTLSFFPVPHDHTWTAWQLFQHYDTPELWSFNILGIVGANHEQAAQNANQALKTLHVESGPTSYNPNEWICHYRTAEGYMAIAGTVPQ